MNKITKYVVIIVGILVMVVLLPLGYVRYKTRYEAEQISASTSPDGDYELVIYSVGKPDFPFGPAHGRLMLKDQEKIVAYRSFEVENDGARFYDDDLETTWYGDRVEAVKAAINKAKVCKKNIAGYDKENKKHILNIQMEI